MDVILNIGLNVASGNNAYDARSERGEVVCATSGFFRRSSTSAFSPPTTTPTARRPSRTRLLCTCSTGSMPRGSVYSAIFNLAQLLDQDCIAVFFTSVQEGLLIGPRANEGRLRPAVLPRDRRAERKPARNAGVSQAA